jgi:hypothetical protein
VAEDEVAVKLRLKGRAEFSKEASVARRDVKSLGDEAQRTGKKMSEGGKTSGAFSKGLGGVTSVAKGVAVGIAGVAAGMTALVGIGIKSASAFKGVAGDVNTLKRYTGATAEQASVLRYTASTVGLSTDVLARGLGIFNKSLAGKNAGKFAVTLGGLGVKVNDVHGKLKPLTSILGDVSDVFNKMPEGPKKTTLAWQLFGKTGVGLLPMLNKGKKGMKEAADEAKKLGLVMGEDDLKAFKESNKQHRLFQAGLLGLQIQIGRYFLPIMTKVVTFFASKMPGAVKWTRDAIDKLKKWFQPMVPMFENFRIKASGALEKFGRWMKVAVDHVQSFFKRNPKAAFAGLAVVLGGAVLGAVVALATAVWSLLTPAILVTAVWALLAVGAIYAYKHFEKFRNVVNAVGKAAMTVFHWFERSALPIIKKVAGEIVVQMGHAVAWFRKEWPRIMETAKHVFGAIRTAALAVFQWFMTSALPVIMKVSKAIVTQFGHAVEWFKKVWPQISEAAKHVFKVIEVIVGVVLLTIMYLWSKWGGRIISIVERLGKMLYSVVGGVMDVVRGVITTILAVINGDWGKAWNGIKEVFTGIWDIIKAVVGTAVGTVKDVIMGLINTLSTPWKAFWNGISDAASSVWDGIVSAAGSAVNTIIDFLNQLNFTFKIPDIIGVPHRGESFTIGISGIGHVNWGKSAKGPAGTHDPHTLHTGGALMSGGAVTVRPGEETIVLPQNASVRPLRPEERGDRPSGADAGGGPLRPIILTLDGKVLAQTTVNVLTGKAARL